MMVRDFQRIVGIEAREQFLDMTGELPDVVCACVGGGSNAIGIFAPFLNDPCELIGVEPLGRGKGVGDNAASMTYGREGIIHGFKCYLLQNEDGSPAPVYSCASGLDYPGVGPEHCYLKDAGRVEYVTCLDTECSDAFFKLTRLEGIIPAIESAHAIAYALVKAREMKTGTILVNLSGRGDKDLDYVLENWVCNSK
jgi:tryptophan synthase beta chain